MTSSVGVFAAAACPRRAASNSIDTSTLATSSCATVFLTARFGHVVLATRAWGQRARLRSGACSWRQQMKSSTPSAISTSPTRLAQVQGQRQQIDQVMLVSAAVWSGTACFLCCTGIVRLTGPIIGILDGVQKLQILQTLQSTKNVLFQVDICSACGVRTELTRSSTGIVGAVAENRL